LSLYAKTLVTPLVTLLVTSALIPTVLYPALAG
jgi:hypothetical protein